jgi:hypothetical protein
MGRGPEPPGSEVGAKGEKNSPDEHEEERKQECPARADKVHRRTEDEHAEGDAGGEEPDHPAGADVVEPDIVIEEDRKESDDAEIRQTFEQIGDVNPPECTRRLEEVDEGLGNFVKRLTEDRAVGAGIGHAGSIG